MDWRKKLQRHDPEDHCHFEVAALGAHASRFDHLRLRHPAALSAFQLCGNPCIPCGGQTVRVNRKA